MAISPELLEILRCPKCKSKVEIKPDRKRFEMYESRNALWFTRYATKFP